MTKRIATLRAVAAWTVAACALAACTEEATVTPVAIEEWTVAPEFEIGDQLEGDALFGRILDVRPAADGSRVYVLDTQSLEVTIWTPDGTRIGRAGGRGEGPGEFSDPGPLFLFDDRFQVGDHSRYTTFALEGEVLRTDGFPPGVGLLDGDMDVATQRRSFTFIQDFAMFADGSVGALGLLPWVMDGDVPEEEDPAIPILRASQDDGAWGIDTLGLLSFRDVFATLDHPDFGEINPVAAVDPSGSLSDGSLERQRSDQPAAEETSRACWNSSRCRLRAMRSGLAGSSCRPSQSRRTTSRRRWTSRRRSSGPIPATCRSR